MHSSKLAAKSKIATHFDKVLRRNFNHFGLGNGAVVNSYLSSPSWVPKKPTPFSKVWRRTLTTLPRFQTERGSRARGLD